MKRIYYWLLAVRLALRWVRRFNLGDSVIYEGRRWTLWQGVGAPFWDLLGEVDYKERVHERELRKVAGVRAAWRSFRAGYRFYMRSWYDIWVRHGLQPWMRSCDIWGRRAAEAKEAES